MSDEYETCMKVLPIDQNLVAESEALRQDGWEQVPEFPAVAFYCLRRVKPKQQPGIAALGALLIDESKVFIQPASKTKN